MVCSIRGITNSVVSEDKDQTEKNVRKAVKMTAAERALATATPASFVVDAVRGLNPKMGGENVHILDFLVDEDGDYAFKYKIGKSNQVIVAKLDRSPAFDTDKEDFPINKTTVLRLYSDYEYTHNNDDFEELALDITNNPEKIMDVAKSLIEADEYHGENEVHNNALLNQLHRITESLVEVVPNLNVHINTAGSKNTGHLNVDTNDIYISKGIGGSKSLLEIYVHELYHAVTHFALDSKSTEMRKITSRMEKVRDNFLDNTSEEDLVQMSGGKLNEQQAGELLDHLSDSKVGLHEFVALSMSNQAVANQLSNLNMTDKEVKGRRNLLQVILDIIGNIFHAVSKRVTGEPDKNDLGRMTFLVTRLHTAHKKPLRARKDGGIRNLLSLFEPVEKRFSDYLEQKIENNTKDVSRNTKKEGESNAKYYARLAARSMYDEQARTILAGVASLASFRGGIFSVLSPEGSIRTILRDAVQSDMTQDQVESLGMISQRIDQQRQFIAVQHAKAVLGGFTRKLTEDEEKLLTDIVLDTDLSAIHHNHNIDKLLADDKNIDKAVDDKVKELETLVDAETLNFYNYQSSLLAEYMITNKDHIALLLNADNIARMVGTERATDSVSPRVVELIDEMTSLKALRKHSVAKKKAFRELYKEEPTGVDHLVAFQSGQNQKSEKELFSTPADKLKMIKGYSVQLADPDINVVTAPLSRQAELEAQGFKLKAELGKHSLDENETPMALFVSYRFMEQGFHRVGMRLTEKARRGVTVTESFVKGNDTHPTLRAAASLRKLRARKDEVVNEMFAGNYSGTNPDDVLVTPVLGNLGQVNDFRYSMDKALKNDLLSMERRVSTVMGRTAAATYDKHATDSFNQQMMEIIEADADENMKEGQKSIFGKNLKEYVKIERDSTNKEIRDLWRVLPEGVKRKHPEGFFVRRNLMYPYLGYREMGAEDALGFGKLMGTNAHARIIKQAIRVAEKIWQEIVKISKIDIIIRTPAVFIGNVISNFMLMYVSGYSFKETTALKFQGVKELNTYVEGLKESIQLNAKLDAGIITSKERRRLSTIENNLANSPVKDLVDEGFYTTIIEEIEHGDDVSGSYFNRIAKKKLANAPKVFRDGIDLLYITENTQLFKLAEKGIQASDFAARYAQYHLMLESGVPKDKALIRVRDNFINYNKPNSRFVEWANKNGFVMFTKYFTRIQRVLRDYGFRHPAKLMLSILAQDYALGEIDDITDQSVFTKDIGNLWYNPTDHFMRVITPSTAEAVAAVL